jgi:hypothetical protein
MDTLQGLLAGIVSDALEKNAQPVLAE